MNAKMIRFVVILGAAGAAWIFGGDDRAQSGDSVVEFAVDDHAMNAAQAEAQRHLSRFFDAALTSNGISKPNTMVKVAFPVEGSQDQDMGVEVIWVGAFQTDGSDFVGQLANEPVAMPGLQAGSRVRFTEDMIRDWILPSEDGRAYGHYTTRVIVAQSDDDNFKQMISQVLMPNPAPASW